MSVIKSDTKIFHTTQYDVSEPKIEKSWEDVKQFYSYAAVNPYSTYFMIYGNTEKNISENSCCNYSTGCCT